MGIFDIGDLITLGLVGLGFMVMKRFDQYNRSLEGVKRFFDKTRTEFDNYMRKNQEHLQDLTSEISSYDKTSKEVLRRIEADAQEVREQAENLNQVKTVMVELLSVRDNVMESLENLKDDAEYISEISRRIEALEHKTQQVEASGDRLLLELVDRNEKSMELQKQDLEFVFEKDRNELQNEITTMKKNVSELHQELDSILVQKEEVLVRNLQAYSHELERVSKVYSQKIHDLESSAMEMKTEGLVAIKENLDHEFEKIKSNFEKMFLHETLYFKNDLETQTDSFHDFAARYEIIEKNLTGKLDELTNKGQDLFAQYKQFDISMHGLHDYIENAFHDESHQFRQEISGQFQNLRNEFGKNIDRQFHEVQHQTSLRFEDVDQIANTVHEKAVDMQASFAEEQNKVADSLSQAKGFVDQEIRIVHTKVKNLDVLWQDAFTELSGRYDDWQDTITVKLGKKYEEFEKKIVQFHDGVDQSLNQGYQRLEESYVTFEAKLSDEHEFVRQEIIQINEGFSKAREEVHVRAEISGQKIFDEIQNRFHDEMQHLNQEMVDGLEEMRIRIQDSVDNTQNLAKSLRERYEKLETGFSIKIEEVDGFYSEIFEDLRGKQEGLISLGEEWKVGFEEFRVKIEDDLKNTVNDWRSHANKAFEDEIADGRMRYRMNLEEVIEDLDQRVSDSVRNLGNLEVLFEKSRKNLEVQNQEQNAYIEGYFLEWKKEFEVEKNRLQSESEVFFSQYEKDNRQVCENLQMSIENWRSSTEEMKGSLEQDFDEIRMRIGDLDQRWKENFASTKEEWEALWSHWQHDQKSLIESEQKQSVDAFSDLSKLAEDFKNEMDALKKDYEIQGCDIQGQWKKNIDQFDQYWNNQVDTLKKELHDQVSGIEQTFVENENKWSVVGQELVQQIESQKKDLYKKVSEGNQEVEDFVQSKFQDWKNTEEKVNDYVEQQKSFVLENFSQEREYFDQSIEQFRNNIDQGLKREHEHLEKNRQSLMSKFADDQEIVRKELMEMSDNFVKAREKAYAMAEISEQKVFDELRSRVRDEVKYLDQEIESEIEEIRKQMSDNTDNTQKITLSLQKRYDNLETALSVKMEEAENFYSDILGDLRTKQEGLTKLDEEWVSNFLKFQERLEDDMCGAVDRWRQNADKVFQEHTTQEGMRYDQGLKETVDQFNQRVDLSVNKIKELEMLLGQYGDNLEERKRDQKLYIDRYIEDWNQEFASQKVHFQCKGEALFLQCLQDSQQVCDDWKGKVENWGSRIEEMEGFVDQHLQRVQVRVDGFDQSWNTDFENTQREWKKVWSDWQENQKSFMEDEQQRNVTVFLELQELSDNFKGQMQEVRKSFDDQAEDVRSQWSRNVDQAEKEWDTRINVLKQELQDRFQEVQDQLESCKDSERTIHENVERQDQLIQQSLVQCQNQLDAHERQVQTFFAQEEQDLSLSTSNFRQELSGQVSSLRMDISMKISILKEDFKDNLQRLSDDFGHCLGDVTQVGQRCSEDVDQLCSEVKASAESNSQSLMDQIKSYQEKWDVLQGSLQKTVEDHKLSADVRIADLQDTFSHEIGQKMVFIDEKHKVFNEKLVQFEHEVAEKFDQLTTSNHEECQKYEDRWRTDVLNLEDQAQKYMDQAKLLSDRYQGDLQGKLDSLTTLLDQHDTTFAKTLEDRVQMWDGQCSVWEEKVVQIDQSLDDYQTKFQGKIDQQIEDYYVKISDKLQSQGEVLGSEQQNLNHQIEQLRQDFVKNLDQVRVNFDDRYVALKQELQGKWDVFQDELKSFGAQGKDDIRGYYQVLSQEWDQKRGEMVTDFANHLQRVQLSFDNKLGSFKEKWEENIDQSTLRLQGELEDFSQVSEQGLEGIRKIVNEQESQWNMYVSALDARVQDHEMSITAKIQGLDHYQVLVDDRLEVVQKDVENYFSLQSQEFKKSILDKLMDLEIRVRQEWDQKLQGVTNKFQEDVQKVDSEFMQFETVSHLLNEEKSKFFDHLKSLTCEVEGSFENSKVWLQNRNQEVETCCKALEQEWQDNIERVGQSFDQEKLYFDDVRNSLHSDLVQLKEKNDQKVQDLVERWESFSAQLSHEKNKFLQDLSVDIQHFEQGKEEIQQKIEHYHHELDQRWVQYCQDLEDQGRNMVVQQEEWVQQRQKDLDTVFASSAENYLDTKCDYEKRIVQYFDDFNVEVRNLKNGYDASRSEIETLRHNSLELMRKITTETQERVEYQKDYIQQQEETFYKEWKSVLGGLSDRQHEFEEQWIKNVDNWYNKELDLSKFQDVFEQKSDQYIQTLVENMENKSLDVLQQYENEIVLEFQKRERDFFKDQVSLDEDKQRLEKFYNDSFENITDMSKKYEEYLTDQRSVLQEKEKNVSDGYDQFFQSLSQDRVLFEKEYANYLQIMENSKNEFDVIKSEMTDQYTRHLNENFESCVKELIDDGKKQQEEYFEAYRVQRKHLDEVLEFNEIVTQDLESGKQVFDQQQQVWNNLIDEFSVQGNFWKESWEQQVRDFKLQQDDFQKSHEELFVQGEGSVQVIQNKILDLSERSDMVFEQIQDKMRDVESEIQKCFENYVQRAGQVFSVQENEMLAELEDHKRKIVDQMCLDFQRFFEEEKSSFSSKWNVADFESKQSQKLLEFENSLECSYKNANQYVHDIRIKVVQKFADVDVFLQQYNEKIEQDFLKVNACQQRLDDYFATKLEINENTFRNIENRLLGVQRDLEGRIDDLEIQQKSAYDESLHKIMDTDVQIREQMEILSHDVEVLLKDFSDRREVFEKGFNKQREICQEFFDKIQLEIEHKKENFLVQESSLQQSMDTLQIEIEKHFESCESQLIHKLNEKMSENKQVLFRSIDQKDQEAEKKLQAITDNVVRIEKELMDRVADYHGQFSDNFTEIEEVIDLSKHQLKYFEKEIEDSRLTLESRMLVLRDHTTRELEQVFGQLKDIISKNAQETHEQLSLQFITQLEDRLREYEQSVQSKMQRLGIFVDEFDALEKYLQESLENSAQRFNKNMQQFEQDLQIQHRQEADRVSEVLDQARDLIPDLEAQINDVKEKAFVLVQGKLMKFEKESVRDIETREIQITQYIEEWQQNVENTLKDFDRQNRLNQDVLGKKLEQETQAYLQSFRSQTEEEMSGCQGRLNDFFQELNVRSGRIEDEMMELYQGFVTRTKNLFDQDSQQWDERLRTLQEGIQGQVEDSKTRVNVELQKISGQLGEVRENFVNLINTYQNECVAWQRQSQEDLKEKEYRLVEDFTDFKNRIYDQFKELNDKVAQDKEFLIQGFQSEMGEISDQFSQKNKIFWGSFENKQEGLEKVLDTLSQRVGVITHSLDDKIDSVIHDLEVFGQKTMAEVEQCKVGVKQDVEQHFENMHSEIKNLRESVLSLRKEAEQAIQSQTETIFEQLTEVETRQKRIDASLEVLGHVNEIRGKFEASLMSLESRMQDFDGKWDKIARFEAEIQRALRMNDELSGRLAILTQERRKLEDLDQKMQDAMELAGVVERKMRQLTEFSHALEDVHSRLQELATAEADLRTQFEKLDDKVVVINDVVKDVDNGFEKMQVLDDSLQQTFEEIASVKSSLEMVRDGIRDLSVQKERVENFNTFIMGIEHKIGDMESRVTRIDEMREWIVQSENRMLDLQKNLKSYMRTMTFTGGSTELQGGNFSDRDAVNDTIIKLAQQGWTPEQIASQLKISVGQVSLVIDRWHGQ